MLTKKKEITFNGLSKADVVVIRTSNSTYHFFVTDPLLRVGILSGGSLGNEQRSAVLVGIWRQTSDVSTLNTAEKQTQSRAVFWLNIPNGVKQLVSSPVTHVAFVKGNPNVKGW